ncbi:MAG: tyrosine-type recombinase/integrase [Magnetococcales bacterium]|nr:tyrosine-type recombinase/integrase [Magnetococcales bacterium]MBF0115997.1 tyrosine-type recombinase/integrase [Magnetococcales bacterium]
MLTDSNIRNAKPTGKAYSKADGGGLFILITETGSKLWRFAYRFDGKQKRLALGSYPDTPLKLARERRDEARQMLARGVDPGELRKATKDMDESRTENSFEAVAREWLVKFTPKWTEGHATKITRRLELDIFPWLGARAVNEITAKDVLAVLRRIEARGVIETVHRAKQNIGQVIRYAIATGRAENDPTAALLGALPPIVQKHHATIVEPAAIAELLRAVDGYQGSYVSRAALRLAPLVFVRPGELRHMEWGEINMESSTWTIPPEKMKMRERHIVPLSTQALAILEELKPLTGGGRYVFPGERSADRPMSENTVNAALRRLGYEVGVMTGHGFRSMASTILNEHGWNRDAIERQLSHGERDQVRGAYNFAEHLTERRKMMRWWGDFLEGLMTGKVVQMHAAAG